MSKDLHNNCFNSEYWFSSEIQSNCLQNEPLKWDCSNWDFNSYITSTGSIPSRRQLYTCSHVTCMHANTQRHKAKFLACPQTSINIIIRQDKSQSALPSISCSTLQILFVHLHLHIPKKSTQSSWWLPMHTYLGVSPNELCGNW